eukprot:3486655-Pyramimonas_sp.AAC.1
MPSCHRRRYPVCCPLDEPGVLSPSDIVSKSGGRRWGPNAVPTGNGSVTCVVIASRGERETPSSYTAP